METWKQRLTAAREAKNLSKTEFARAVGISTATATDWEKAAEDGGIAELKGKNLTKITEVLGVMPGWLLDGRLPIRPGESAQDPVALKLADPPPKPPEEQATPEEIMELMACFVQTSARWRKNILTLARRAPARDGAATWTKISSD